MSEFLKVRCNEIAGQITPMYSGRGARRAGRRVYHLGRLDAPTAAASRKEQEEERGESRG